MSRLLVWVAILGTVLVVAAFVPLGGRTVVERWRASPTATDFIERCYGEVAGALARLRDDPLNRRAHAAAKAPGRGPPRAGPQARPAPQERHTDADRSALDRIVAERTGPAR